MKKILLTMLLSVAFLNAEITHSSENKIEDGKLLYTYTIDDTDTYSMICDKSKNICDIYDNNKILIITTKWTIVKKEKLMNPKPFVNLLKAYYGL